MWRKKAVLLKDAALLKDAVLWADVVRRLAYQPDQQVIIKDFVF